MKAVIVRIFVDLIYAGDGKTRDLKDFDRRVVFDKPFVVSGANGESNTKLRASSFCHAALENGISFIDEKNANSIRYIPARNIITLFQMPCKEIKNEEFIKKQEAIDIQALPFP